MDIWNKIKSTIGLTTDENGLDSRGVDHSKMSIRDELKYQMDNAKDATDKEESVFDAFARNYNNVIKKFGADRLIDNLYNLGYDAGERLGHTQTQTDKYENRSSVGMAQAEAQRLHPINVSDINKHQYVSCVGSSEGPVSALVTGAAGLYKEGADLKRKWGKPQYGTNTNIVLDGIKDLKNDAIGVIQGLTSETVKDCDKLLPANIRRKRY